MATARANNFDLTRLILATAVLFTHAFDLGGRPDPLVETIGTVSFGSLAVSGFFLLSGYLITASWRSDPNLGRYASRRIARIVPAFAAAFAASTLLVGPLGAADPLAYLAALPSGLWAELLLLSPPHTPPTFVGTPVAVVNGSMWTIQWEVLCYLLVPVLTLCLRRRAVVVVAWCAMAGVTLLFPQGAPLKFMLMFFSGAILAVSPPADYRWWPWAILAVLLSWASPWTATLGLATAGAYAFFAGGLAKPILPRIPDVSYGVFLYGWPVEKLIIWWGVANPWAVFALALPVTLAVGYLSHRFVEKPAMDFARAVLRRPRTVAGFAVGGA